MKHHDNIDEIDSKEPNKNLVALLSNKSIPNDFLPHKYEPDTNSGIGFCKICFSDDENDGAHIMEYYEY